MENYRAYLKELKTTTLFQDIPDEELIALLEAMQPKIVMRKAGEPMPPMPEGTFKMALRATPDQGIVPRKFKYDMPKFGEPGMLMAEIPTYSRMFEGLKRRPGGPMHKPTPIDYDLEMLEFTEGMMTAFYGEQHAHAQGIMLRNFLGILAQKVCDVRHELFLIRDARDMFQETDKTLQVFTAGVAIGVTKEAIQRWNLKHPELQAEMHPGGSVDLIRQVLAGERCDVLILADDTNIESMLMPKYARGYKVFAGNKMVIAGKGINSENWMERLLDPSSTFSHTNPYGDPSGYRAIMTILLADRLKKGMAHQLMSHPGHLGMEHDPAKGKLMPEADYMFTYYSGAKARGGDFAELPESIDLSSQDLKEEYAKVSFAVDDENTVYGAPIVHALTIPETAKFKDAAKEFAAQFLASDFAAFHFLPRTETVGEDILK